MASRQDLEIALFDRIRSDDRAALNALFSHYYQRLCSFANTFLVNRSDAEECVADVFVALWRNRKNITIETSLTAYLYTSVKNAAWSVLRNRNMALVDLESASLLKTEYDCPENLYRYAELEDQLRHALDSLPPRCKQVFIMSRADGMTYQQISNVLGITPNTVENHLVKALDIIRHHIKRYRSEFIKPTRLTKA